MKLGEEFPHEIANERPQADGHQVFKWTENAVMLSASEASHTLRPDGVARVRFLAALGMTCSPKAVHVFG